MVIQSPVEIAPAECHGSVGSGDAAELATYIVEKGKSLISLAE